MPGVKISGAYEIVNVINGKRYVGASVDIHDRWLHHVSALRRGVHRNKNLQRDWNKHGERNFKLRLLLQCPPDRILLDSHELSFLRRRDASALYNANPTAVSMLGFKHSKATRKQMGEWQCGRKLGDETKAKMSAAHKGRQYTLGYKHDDEFRRRRREYMLTNNPNDDPEVRRKKSIKMKAWWSSQRKKGVRRHVD